MKALQRLFTLVLIGVCPACDRNSASLGSAQMEIGASAADQTTQSKSIIAATQLVGLWETANVEKPFDMRNPKLTLSLGADGSLVSDESTNREMRGTWRLDRDKIIAHFTSVSYSNRIRRLSEGGTSVLLEYEMYDNKPLALRKVR
jgi:hypothetical protein